MEKHSSNGEPAKKSLRVLLKPQAFMLAVALFSLAGVAGGYVYYLLVGCKTGTCAITSNPYLSMIWGGVMGYLLSDLIFKKAS